MKTKLLLIVTATSFVALAGGAMAHPGGGGGNGIGVGAGGSMGLGAGGRTPAVLRGRPPIFPVRRYRPSPMAFPLAAIVCRKPRPRTQVPAAM